MTAANWVASDLANWIFFGIGVLSAALAVVETWFRSRDRNRHAVTRGGRGPASPDWYDDNPHILGNDRLRASSAGKSVWLLALIGPLLLLGGVVLVGTGAGRLSWLSIVSGAVCLVVLACLALLHETRKIARRQQAEAAGGEGIRHSAWLISREAEALGRTAGRISDDVGHWRHDMLRTQNPSALAKAVYRELANEGKVLSQTAAVESFDDFANSMTRAGIWAPVMVYTSADDGVGLKDAVLAVLREFGLESAVEEPPIRGSWFQRLWARGREAAESEPVHTRLAKLERALELEHLGKRQAEIDKAKAESVAALYALVKEQQNAVVRMGSIIMIKTEGDLVVWTIGEMEAAALEKDSELLRDPVAALKFLRGGDRVRDRTSLQPHAPAGAAPGALARSAVRITDRVHLAEALWSGADLSNTDFSDADLSGADLSEANLPKAALCRAKLAGADLRRANLSAANLLGADLRNAKLAGANLRQASLLRAFLSGADLAGANLSAANLREAPLRGANLLGADLCGALLDVGDLQLARLEGVKWNERTLWPDCLAGEIQGKSRELQPGVFVVVQRSAEEDPLL